MEHKFKILVLPGSKAPHVVLKNLSTQSRMRFRCRSNSEAGEMAWTLHAVLRKYSVGSVDPEIEYL